jgi:hypothetical protein
MCSISYAIVGKRVSRDVHAQDCGGNARLELRRQLRDQPLGLEGGISGRLRPERIEMGRKMTVHAVRLHESHRSGDGAEQLIGDRLLLGRGLYGYRSGSRSRSRVAVPGRLQEAGKTGMRGDDVAVAALEEPAPFARDRVGVLEVLLEQIAREARVQPVDVGHYVLCSNEPLPEGMARDHRHREPDREARSPDRDRIRRKPFAPAADSGGDQREQDREGDEPQRPVGHPDKADEDRSSCEKARNRLGRPALPVGPGAHTRTVARAVRA